MMRYHFWLGPIFVTLGCAGPEFEPEISSIESGDPEIVGEGVISTDRNQTFPAVDPVSRNIWFSEYDDSFDAQTILLSRWERDGWRTPEVAPFSGEWGDRAPRFSPDGSSILFTSNRPRPGSELAGDMNIWRVDREFGEWGTPRLLESPINSDGNDMHTSLSLTATWLASSREDSLGRSDIYRIDTDGGIFHLPPPLNDERSQPDLWMNPDESWMILVITDHPDGFGGDDLYVSRQDGDTWSTPVNLGPKINTPEYEYGPSVSPDGQYLYFTSHRTGPSHVYRVPMQVVRSISAQR